MEETDAVLVERARHGEAAAFEALVRRHLRSAYAVALARLGRPADAEDVCQEAFLTALERLDACRRPERFGAWLLAIVRNRALDQLRARGRREGEPLDAAARRADGADPERDASRSELRAELLAGLGELTPTQREVVLLFDLEGFSHREIGERLGISEGSSRVHLHNARRSLERHLAARRPGETTEER